MLLPPGAACLKGIGADSTGRSRTALPGQFRVQNQNLELDGRDHSDVQFSGSCSRRFVRVIDLDGQIGMLVDVPTDILFLFIFCISGWLHCGSMW